MDLKKIVEPTAIRRQTTMQPKVLEPIRTTSLDPVFERFPSC